MERVEKEFLKCCQICMQQQPIKIQSPSKKRKVDNDSNLAAQPGTIIHNARRRKSCRPAFPPFLSPTTTITEVPAMLAPPKKRKGSAPFRLKYHHYHYSHHQYPVPVRPLLLLLLLLAKAGKATPGAKTKRSGYCKGGQAHSLIIVSASESGYGES